jgi:hypothetical protein
MNKFLPKKQLKRKLFHDGYFFEKMLPVYTLRKMSYGGSKISGFPLTKLGTPEGIG